MYNAAQQIGGEATIQKKARKYREALEAISGLRPAVDLFFDKVLVMVEDQNVRRNRVALLAGLLKEFSDDCGFFGTGR